MECFRTGETGACETTGKIEVIHRKAPVKPFHVERFFCVLPGASLRQASRKKPYRFGRVVDNCGFVHKSGLVVRFVAA